MPISALTHVSQLARNSHVCAIRLLSRQIGATMHNLPSRNQPWKILLPKLWLGIA